MTKEKRKVGKPAVKKVELWNLNPRAAPDLNRTIFEQNDAKKG